MTTDNTTNAASSRTRPPRNKIKKNSISLAATVSPSLSSSPTSLPTPPRRHGRHHGRPSTSSAQTAPAVLISSSSTSTSKPSPPHVVATVNYDKNSSTTGATRSKAGVKSNKKVSRHDASSTTSNASAPTQHPTSSSISSSSSSSNKKKSRHRLASLFQFRKGQQDDANQRSSKKLVPTIFKSKSALLTEFSLLMNEFPAQDALNTTLHVACLKHYSQELIIHQLIAKGPAAVSMKNQSQDLPLHCAMKCTIGNGVETEVYDALVGIYPVGIQARNVDGCLPIHLVCQSGGRNLSVIEKLVKAYPLGLVQRCGLKVPLSGTDEHLSFRYVSLSESGGSSRSMDDGDGNSSSGEIMSKKDGSPGQEMTWGASFWSALLALSPLSSPSSLDSPGDNVNVMTTGEVAESGIESSFTPLHLAVMNGAPPDVVETLLDANPLCLSIKTDRGRAPLDIAECLIAKQKLEKGHSIKNDVKVVDENNSKGAENNYFENIDCDPIQNIMAAREILKTFQRIEKKSVRLMQAAKFTSLSIADLHTNSSTTTNQQEFNPEKTWKKISHVIAFTSSLSKQSASSGLGPLIALDKNIMVKPPNYKLPQNLSHLCVDIDIPVGFRRLRWAMLSSKSKFLTMEVMENKLGFSDIQMGAWDKLDSEIGQTESNIPFGSPESKSYIGAQRHCQYLMPKTALVKANMAYETHTIVEYNDYTFVTHKITRTPHVPFGSSFESHVQTIIVNMGNDTCKMIASVEAKFLDKPPMIAWKIKSAMYSGVTDYFVAKGETICEHAFQEHSSGSQ
eukprot:CAMPEP_0176483824 /NCGR_PEP_ID=MMETSP0200_2-20121128/4124_1 /TAXON_ID=947934 /ORGANISM="Chaetoceros sp., Strain GSL56" /LENGTH=789 /DNA_ID=CAMNT_0017880251 /DNA_START=251 /DNA_END=2620 /DNA_ORIENTATION=-